MGRNRIGLKEGVRLEGRHLDPEVHKIVSVALSTAPETIDGILWVTSASDGKHMSHSKHYLGEAFDFRIWNIQGYKGPKRVDGKLVWTKQDMIENWAQAMRVALGDDYDVVYGDGGHLDHVHAEWDPSG